MQSDKNIVILRIAMEENIFEQRTSARRYTNERPTDVPEIFVTNKRRLQAIRTASFLSLFLMIFQTVAGVLSNSLVLIADSGRLFADFIEQHHYSQIDTPVIRKFELVSIFGSSVAVTVINAICVIAAVNRLYLVKPMTSIAINFPWMMVGTVLALTTNCLLLLIHYKNDWTVRPEQRHRFVDAWKNKRPQLLHGFINHGFGVTVLACAILVYYGYPIADSVGTLVVSIFAFANVVSAIRKVLTEYKTFKFFQENYEVIDDDAMP